MPPFVGLILFFIFSLLAFFFIDYIRMVKNLKRSLLQVKQSFEELDEQAKLIVQTDLELNKAQEALDKRLNGLDALHKISRLISTTLVEDEIFSRLNQPLLTELGFEKFLIFTLSPSGQLHCRVDFGYPEENAKSILAALAANRNFLENIQEAQMISSVNAPENSLGPVTSLFEVQHFVLASIRAQEKFLGFILGGNQTAPFFVTEGDEEILSILADQIGHALENAQLFEQVYRSRQELELKVQTRTQELSSALEEVQRISRTKSEFISAVSHELRTPLTSIKGYAAILISGKLGQIPDKVKERLEKINNHTNNLVDLINNLLDISRCESGQVKINYLEHDIPSIINNVFDLLTPQLRDKQINFQTDIVPDLPTVYIDVDQIERVFINILGNALKFTPPRGTITVRAFHDDRKVTVEISDTGIGISPEDLKKLFNEFYRVENEINQNVKGTGLGLALVKKILHAQGGDIWVTSQVGKGTTFHFTIPRGVRK